MFGLQDKDIKLIKEAIHHFVEIEYAIIFGSRAMGNYKKGSDIDIAINGRDVTQDTVANLSDTLNDILPLPYFFDILDYNTISNENLIEHIDHFGVEIFSREGK